MCRKSDGSGFMPRAGANAEQAGPRQPVGERRESFSRHGKLFLFFFMTRRANLSLSPFLPSFHPVFRRPSFIPSRFFCRPCVARHGYYYAKYCTADIVGRGSRLIEGAIRPPPGKVVVTLRGGSS